MTIRQFLASFVYRISYYRWRGKVTLLHKNVHFYRTTSISLSEGATKDNIQLDYEARIHGTLSSCSTGKIYVGKYSQIGPGSIIRSLQEVRLGAYVAISTNVVISDNNTHPVNPLDRLVMQQTPMGSKERSWVFSESAPIIIEDNCWIGENARICKGVTIGEGAVVAANAVVTKNVPANTIAAGNPARIVKTDIDQTSPRYF